MPTLSPCLTPTELEQFLLGRTDEDRALGIEEHLQECPDCQQRLSSLDANDELVRALRGPSPTTAAEASDASLDEAPPELVNLLVPHFKRIGSALEETVEMAGGDTQSVVEFVSQTSPAPKVATEVEDVDLPQQLGRYEVRGVLGRGGMGTVLHAFDPLLNRSIAVKVLQAEWLAEPGMAERMVREAQAAAAFQHDNIVPIYAVELRNGHPCIVMPLLQGVSLHQRLQDVDGPLPLGEFLQIARDVGQGLAAAHAAGLIHCDIKPANLWLEAPNDRVKILDFGLAIAHGDGNRDDGRISGTPGYLAPEQAKGLPLDQRTDIFSLGCVLYRMATGQSPFTGERRLRALWTVLAEPPVAAAEINPDLPEELSDLISQMMSRDPGDRPATVTEVLDALDAYERRVAELRGGVVRRRWLLAMFGVAVLSSAGVGAWAMFAAPRAAKPVPVTFLGGSEPLAIKLRRDGLETPVTLARESVVSLPPGEYSTHLVEELPGRELIPRNIVIEENQPVVIATVLVGEIARHSTHTRAVTGIAVQNGMNAAEDAQPARIWSVGLDRTLVFWDGTASLEPRFATLPHEGRCVALSPQGQQVATAGGNKQTPRELAIRHWDARTLAELDTPLEGHERLIFAMAYSPDGQHLVSAGAEGVLVWNLPAGDHAVLPESDAHTVQAVAYSRDGQQLLTGGESGTVAMWDMQTQTKHRSHVVGEATIRAVAFLPDGYLAAGDDGTVWAWKTSSDKPQTVVVRPQPVTCLAVSPTGDQIVFGDGSGTVGVWSLKTHQLSYEFRGHRGPVNTAAFINDGRKAVSGGVDGTVRLWQLPFP